MNYQYYNYNLKNNRHPDKNIKNIKGNDRTNYFNTNNKNYNYNNNKITKHNIKEKDKPQKIFHNQNYPQNKISDGKIRQNSYQSNNYTYNIPKNSRELYELNYKDYQTSISSKINKNKIDENNNLKSRTEINRNNQRPQSYSNKNYNLNKEKDKKYTQYYGKKDNNTNIFKRYPSEKKYNNELNYKENFINNESGKYKQNNNQDNQKRNSYTYIKRNNYKPTKSKENYNENKININEEKYDIFNYKYNTEYLINKNFLNQKKDFNVNKNDNFTQIGVKNFIDYKENKKNEIKRYYSFDNNRERNNNLNNRNLNKPLYNNNNNFVQNNYNSNPINNNFNNNINNNFMQKNFNSNFMNNNFQNFNNYNNNNNNYNNFNNNIYQNIQNNFNNMMMMMNNNFIKNNQNNFYNQNFNNFNNNNWNNLAMNLFNNNNNNLEGNSNNHHIRKHSSLYISNDKFPIVNIHANGLENVGATCYMNATLQCLAHIEKLTKYFLKPKIITQLTSNSFKYKLSQEYLKVIQNLWTNKNCDYFSPINFKERISQMNPLFAGIQANDSKDLVLFLLETMHNELNEAKKNYQPNQNINQYNYEQTFQLFSQYFTNNYDSVISHLFYGMYNSMMTCFNCKVTTNNVQCYNILIFPLEEVRKFKNRIDNRVDIIECFEYYEKDDYMTGENQIHCNKCMRMANSLNKSKIIIGPNVLVINLNRGKGLQFDVKLSFGEYLNIRNFIYYQQSPYYYELIGIVTHFGPSNMGGHFIAFCKSFRDKNWYKYNDAIVTSSSFQEARNTGVPYILFYSKKQ